MAMEKEEQKREHKELAEAALFVSGKALSAEELASALGISSIGYFRRLMDELVEEGKSSAGPFSVSRIGEKYELGVKEPYASRVNGLAGKPDITRGSLKVLAYVSKNEPIMQSSIVRAFGSSTYDHIRELVEKDFITTKKVGRTKRVATTARFREYFNVRDGIQQALQQ